MEKSDKLKEWLEYAQKVVDSGKLPYMVITSPDSGIRFAVFPSCKPCKE